MIRYIKTVFRLSNTAATIFFAAHFGVATIQGWLLFKDGNYFFGMPTDINDDWIRYIRAIQPGDRRQK